MSKTEVQSRDGAPRAERGKWGRPGPSRPEVRGASVEILVAPGLGGGLSLANLSALLLQLARCPPVGRPDSRAGASRRRKRDPLGWSLRSAAAQLGDLGNPFCPPGLCLPIFLHDGHRNAHDSVVAGVGAPHPPASAGNKWARRGAGRPAVPPLPSRPPPPPRPPPASGRGHRPPLYLPAGRPGRRGPRVLGDLAPRHAPARSRYWAGERGTGGGRRGCSRGRRSRAQGAEPEPGHPRVRAGGRWGTRWNGTHLREWAGPRWPGRGEARGSLLPLRKNVGRLQGHKGCDYLELDDDMRGSHLGAIPLVGMGKPVLVSGKHGGFPTQ